MPIDKPLYEQAAQVIEELGDTDIDMSDDAIFDPETGEPFTEEVEAAELEEEQGPAFDDNLADWIEDFDLDGIANDLDEAVQADEESRADWINTYRQGIELLGLKIEELEEPFAGACSATHPLLIESIVKFQSKALAELCPAKGPVRTQIIGNPSPEKEAQARRVREFMNYQINHIITEWREEVDQMLFYLGLSGSAFKKTFWDQNLGRPTTCYIKSEDFLINYNASSLSTARRYSHKYICDKNDIIKRMSSGEWSAVDLTEAGTPEENDAKAEIARVEDRSQPPQVDEEHVLYETHTYLDLPGFESEDGVELPYIVTWEKDSRKILSIRRNWKEDDPLAQKRVWFTHYKLIPGLGFYGYGFLHLIGGLSRTSTSSLRQLTDAGTFSNLPAGFKARGLRVVDDQQPIMPGEWREINAAGLEISKSLMPLPYKEPSLTLFNLLQYTVETAQKFADATEQVVADSTNYGPVGTTMALLEASGKLFSAIHMRLHYAQMQDLKTLAEINFENLPDNYPYETAGASRAVLREDFDGRIDIVPVSDPNMPSRSHRVAKAQALSAQAQAFPQDFNTRVVNMEVVAALDYENPENFLAPQVQPFVGDAVSENATAMTGKPIAAAQYQNHDAHMIVHAAAMEDPAFQNNELMRPILAAHLKEHMKMKYLAQMQQAMGGDMPQGEMTPEIEAQIDQAAAQVAEQVVAQNRQDEEQKRLKEMMQDPDFVTKQRDLDLEETKITQDYDVELRKIALDARKIEIDDENADLDREADIGIVREQNKARLKGGASKNS